MIGRLVLASILQSVKESKGTSRAMYTHPAAGSHRRLQRERIQCRRGRRRRSPILLGAEIAPGPRSARRRRSPWRRRPCSGRSGCASPAIGRGTRRAQRPRRRRSPAVRSCCLRPRPPPRTRSCRAAAPAAEIERGRYEAATMDDWTDESRCECVRESGALNGILYEGACLLSFYTSRLTSEVTILATLITRQHNTFKFIAKFLEFNFPSSVLLTFSQCVCLDNYAIFLLQ